MIRSVLFDLDGTLFDDEIINLRSKMREAKKYGYELKEKDAISAFGLSVEASAAYFRKIYGNDFPYENISNSRCGHILKHIKKHGYPYKPYARELIMHLKEKNIIVGICTATRRKTIESYRPYGDLFDLVDFVVCGDEVIRSKPFPDIFLQGVKLSGLLKEENLVVEDSINGVNAALSGKLNVVMIPDFFTPDVSSLDNKIKLIKNLQELEKYIDIVNKL